MMDNSYMDPAKSVIISSPAGSGKTEKLAMRYISLLKNGAEVERILCITFTEKAAAEMKDRILSRLQEKEPGLLERIRPKIPLMRISTIHAFCLRLLKRFSVELGLEPGLSIMDEHQASTLWSESVYGSLMHDKDEFFGMIKARGIKGWNSLRSALDAVHSKEPAAEMLLAEGAEGLGEQAERLMKLYAICLRRYKEKKERLGLLDFSDIEVLSHTALTTVPEAQNILMSFDMHTDHILVDEFQDTNTIQWRIIEKLTEEWRAGLGMKRESGETPTIFLVGDDKQSIYLFRGASSGIFTRAAEELRKWLGDELLSLMETRNYRSEPEIIRFVNDLFSRVMDASQPEEWRSRYAAFEPDKSGKGHVRCLVVNAEGKADERRAAEAAALASHIRSIAGTAPEWRPGGVSYMDMAILLRNRTHLAKIEDALRAWDIPFVVVSGIGFNDEPEVALLHELVGLLVDPSDRYAMFCVLRSPIIGMRYEEIASICLSKDAPMKALGSVNPEAHARLSSWIDALRAGMPMSTLIERAMDESGAWRSVSEPQRLANCRKFIQIVESMEESLRHPSSVEVREMLMRFRSQSKMPKANVNAEDMNAVRIMTVHASKGLQFPAVFLPFMDEGIRPKMESLVLDDEMGRIRMAFEEDSRKRKDMDIFRTRQEKLLEEEKRHFYVAATRAMEYLCMSGTPSGKDTEPSRLKYIAEAFGLEDISMDEGAPLTITNISPDDIGEPPAQQVDRARRPISRDMASLDLPIAFAPSRPWRDVTEELGHGAETQGHGAHWSALGDILHRCLDMISRGHLHADAAQQVALRMLPGSLSQHSETLKRELGRITANDEIMRIVMPQDGAHSELPFILEAEDAIYRGRMDRLILRDGIARLYDYKTYPLAEDEIGAEIEKYAPQLRIYAEAASKLFCVPCEPHIVFTSIGRVVKL